MEIIHHFFKNFDPFWATFFVSMVPIGELRLGIPIGIVVYNMDPLVAFFAGFLGNFTIVPFILFGFEKLYKFTKSSKNINFFYSYIFKRTKSKSSLIKNAKSLGLLLFVAIPLPFTGAWTGCMAAFLFSIDRKRALFASAVGLLISASIITIFSSFFYSIFK